MVPNTPTLRIKKTLVYYPNFKKLVRNTLQIIHSTCRQATNYM